MPRDEFGPEKPTKELAQASRDAGPLTLQLIGEGFVATFPLRAGRPMLLGRARAVDICIDHESISRQHARLVVDPDGLWIEDLNSANGTTVAGNKLSPGVACPVQVGQLIQLGAVSAVVQRGADAAGPGRRMWSHAFFEAKLDEACAHPEASPGGRFALVRIGVREAALARALEAAVVAALAPEDVLGSYGPGELEILRPGIGPAEATSWLAAVVREVGPRARTGLACFPDDSRSPHALLARACGDPSEPPGGSAPLILDEAMRRVYAMVDRIARSELPVLVTGETGVGKELLSAAVHERSGRKGPLVRINCAAISETLLESELFGHEKGAFTGATSAKAGLLESAAGGTVFLDEVGELPLSLQAKLLRVLEAKQVLRVGALRPRDLDVRFVSATNRDLEAEARAGRFRGDLYFRLNGVTLHVPPLRERPAEVVALAERFVAEAAQRAGRGGMRLGEAAKEALRRHRWPGNVRELKNAIERAVLLSDGPTLDATHLPDGKVAAPVSGFAEPVEDTFGRMSPEHQAERQRLLDALEECKGNQTHAAQRLGISRGTLLAKLDAYRIPRPRKTPPIR